MNGIEQASRGQSPLEALVARAANTPDAIALVADDHAWTCRRLVDDSARVASALRASGIGAGDRVALHAANHVEVVLLFLAAWRVGAIVVPINTRFKMPELRSALERTRPRLYVGAEELAGVSDGIDDELLRRGDRIVFGAAEPPDGARRWSDWIASVDDRLSFFDHAAPIDRDAPVVLLGTSGTTGDSKLVVWTTRTLASFAATASIRMLGADDIFALVWPMTHASGVWALSTALLTGARLILLPRFEADGVLDAISRHRCTGFGSLPFSYAELVKRQSAAPRDLGSLRACHTAGDTCPSGIEDAVASVLGRPLLSWWASTEECAAAIPSTKPGPFTGMLPEAGLRLVDASGGPVPDGDAGEMLIRSAGTTPGYWTAPGQVERLADGWFHTGDLMRREPDGSLRYLGRLKHLIVRGGSNVSPVEVENVLRRQPAIGDAVVAGIADPVLGERVGALLVLREGASRSAAGEAISAARRELADYKVPERFLVVDALPRSALMKVDRVAAAERLREAARSERSSVAKPTGAG